MQPFWSICSEATKMWQGIAQSSLDTSETLQHRMAILYGIKAPPANTTYQGEVDLMVSEKLRAVTDGAMDAGWQTLMFCMQSSLGAHDMASVARAGMAISQAGMKPAQDAVKSNALRLSAVAAE